VLYLHTGFVLFVVLGLLLVIAGGAMGWNWVRNRAFRFCHVLAIGVVVLQAWLGVLCPLTRLEMNLRVRGGDATYPGSFIAHWVERFLYYDAPDWVFVLVYTAFGLAVLASWFHVRPYPQRVR
jgi:hypothetical protein